MVDASSNWNGATATVISTTDTSYSVSSNIATPAATTDKTTKVDWGLSYLDNSSSLWSVKSGQAILFTDDETALRAKEA